MFLSTDFLLSFMLFCSIALNCLRYKLITLSMKKSPKEQSLWGTPLYYEAILPFYLVRGDLFSDYVSDAPLTISSLSLTIPYIQHFAFNNKVLIPCSIVFSKKSIFIYMTTTKHLSLFNSQHKNYKSTLRCYIISSIYMNHLTCDI